MSLLLYHEGSNSLYGRCNNYDQGDRESYKEFPRMSIMKIIGAGFGRTGTLSLKHALEELGFGPCYHMKTALTRPWHIPFWLNAERKSARQWRKFFRNYQATVDWPASEFYKELTEVWPEAKVILTYRDPESWYQSCLKTIYRMQNYFPWWFPKIFVKLQDKHIWQGRFQGRFEERDFAISNYLAHIEEVKKLVPPEKLLVYDVRQGWEPLCDFLNIPVPDQDFPHLHDTDAYLSYIRKVKVWATVIAFAVFIIILMILYMTLY
jgi:hypothetical protein